MLRMNNKLVGNWAPCAIATPHTETVSVKQTAMSNLNWLQIAIFRAGISAASFFEASFFEASFFEASPAMMKVSAGQLCGERKRGRLAVSPGDFRARFRH